MTSSQPIQDGKATFTGPVDKNDEDEVKHYMSRDIPLFRSVFHYIKPGCNLARHSSKVSNRQEEKRAPFWLALSGDLAWSAAFGSLTNNRTMSGPGDITNYAVFFALMWLLWGSQTAYEIKYYTNDWWHRFIFVLQLLSYGTLASFTADFDVFWRFRDISDEIFTENVSQFTGAAMITAAQRARSLSLEGVSIVMYTNRFILWIQYLVVEFHRSHCEVPTFKCHSCNPDGGNKRCWHYYSIPCSIFASALMFLGGHLTIRFGPLTQATSSVLFSLWFAAILTESAGYALSHLNDESDEHSGQITDRLSSLTVVIIGEGLNSIFQITKFTVNAVGVGPKMIAILFALGITLYNIWMCYFEDYRKEPPQNKLRREAWFLLHSVFHLLLILVLEGLKNMILQTNLVISMELLGRTFLPNGLSQAVKTAQLVDILEKLGMSWSQFTLDQFSALDRGDEAYKIWYQRFVLKVHRNLFQKYTDLDEESVYRVEEYDRDDTKVLADLAEISLTGNWGSAFQGIIEKLEEPLFNATTYLVPLTGAAILFLAFLNILQRTPTDRFGWGTALTKMIGGIVLIILVVVHIHLSHGANLGATVWRIPTLAITLTVIIFVQFALLKFAVWPLKYPNPSDSEQNTGMSKGSKPTQPDTTARVDSVQDGTPEKSRAQSVDIRHSTLSNTSQ